MHHHEIKTFKTKYILKPKPKQQSKLKKKPQKKKPQKKNHKKKTTK